MKARKIDTTYSSPTHRASRFRVVESSSGTQDTKDQNPRKLVRWTVPLMVGAVSVGFILLISLSFIGPFLLFLSAGLCFLALPAALWVANRKQAMVGKTEDRSHLMLLRNTLEGTERWQKTGVKSTTLDSGDESLVKHRYSLGDKGLEEGNEQPKRKSYDIAV